MQNDDVPASVVLLFNEAYWVGQLRVISTKQSGWEKDHFLKKPYLFFYANIETFASLNPNKSNNLVGFMCTRLQIIWLITFQELADHKFEQQY